MANINAGVEGAMDFIISGRMETERRWKEMEDGLNKRLDFLGVKIIFIKHGDVHFASSQLLFVIPKTKIGEDMFWDGFFEPLISEGMWTDKMEEFIRESGRWYVYQDFLKRRMKIVNYSSFKKGAEITKIVKEYFEGYFQVKIEEKK